MCKADDEAVVESESVVLHISSGAGAAEGAAGVAWLHCSGGD